MRKGRKIVFVLGLVGRVYVSITVAKYNIFPSLTMAARVKKILAKRFSGTISEHCRDLEHAYVYWIWLRGSASYVIISHKGTRMVKDGKDWHGLQTTKLFKPFNRDWAPLKLHRSSKKISRPDEKHWEFSYHLKSFCTKDRLKYHRHVRSR